MSRTSKWMCGVILLTVPTIQYGGYFLLQILSGKVNELGLNEFQKDMFRAGHAHAGVLVILALIAQILADHARLPNYLEWISRILFPLSAVLISGGFFGAAAGENVSEPGPLIALLYIGAVFLAIALWMLGIGLIRSKN